MPKGVLNDDRILLMHQEYGFLQLPALHLIHEDREWVAPELLEIPVSLGVDDAGILITGKLEAAAIQNQRFFNLGQQNHPADGRLGGGHQQTVVSAGIEPDDGRRGVPADSIRLQPLPPAGGWQIVTGVLAELAHLLERYSKMSPDRLLLFESSEISDDVVQIRAGDSRY